MAPTHSIRVWHTKDYSRSRDSLLSSQQPYLSQSFGLFPSHSAFIASLCIRQFAWAQKPLLFHKTAQTAAWPEMKETCVTGAGAMSELALRGQWASQVWSQPLAWASIGQSAVSYLNLKCACQNQAAQCLTSLQTSAAELVCWSWEFYHPLQFKESAHAASWGKQSTCQSVLLGQSRRTKRWNLLTDKSLAMSFTEHQLPSHFSFRSHLADSTKKVWKMYLGKIPLLSQCHARCCLFLWSNWTTAQSSQNRRPAPQSCYFY